MHRTWAIIERELRRFRRSPTLIVMSMVMPLVQLVVLGYAFGGNVKHLKVGVVDQDHGVPAVQAARAGERRRRERAARSTPSTTPIRAQAITDLRNGRLNGVLTIPPDFSRRVLAKDDPHVALIEDNTDNFVSATLAATHGRPGRRPTTSRRRRPRVGAEPRLDVVEVYPYVPVHPVPAARARS